MIRRCYLLIGLVLAVAPPALAAESGLKAGDLFRGLGIAVAVVALLGIILVEFVFHERIPSSAYRFALLIFLLVLPIVTLMATTEAVFSETKTVDSCNSCHNMEPFVADMRDPHSPTLAAQHYDNGWIPQYQCYQCHTTYGVHGTLAGKRDGFRHWLLYVTDTWDEPIQFSGSYPNVNCLNCHGGTDAFRAQRAHAAVRADLEADRISCASCHGPPHPSPLERTARELLSLRP